ncbi:glycosyltransferase family 2 protein [Halalkalibacillus halophilus]|uniref:glycosyltransferase family 2 protein n=1 Tax=Halalkalibacillus halophilus TaxID=392827 RepID=UPI00040AFDF7|nr:glycosyltransferase [Halalkalibacillus halophilus]
MRFDPWTVILFEVIGWVILAYMFIIITVYTFMYLVSYRHLRSEKDLNRIDDQADYMEFFYSKPVSILVPAYNEREGVIASVRSLINLRYPLFEIVVINDGSSDRTLEILSEEFELFAVEQTVKKSIPSQSIKQLYKSRILPNLTVVDKDNSGKADSLNVGINVCKYPYFCSVDGDSILETDALLKVMKPVINSNEDVVATGGNIRVANGCIVEQGIVKEIGLPKNPLAIMQVIEYLRAFLIGRVGLSRHNMLLIISGAFSVFQKKMVIESGGYETDTVGEDMELVVKMHRKISDENLNKRITFVSDPVCWTEVPETAKQLGRQRKRWHRGLTETLFKHKDMAARKKYGKVGTISLPYFWVIEFFGPIIEFFGYAYLLFTLLTGTLYVELAILIFASLFLYGSLFSSTSVLLEAWSISKYSRKRDVTILFFFSLTEIFWYRPLTVFWRMVGLFQYVMKYRSWGEMKRKGIGKTS